jgi:hypothetical protein
MRSIRRIPLGLLLFVLLALSTASLQSQSFGRFIGRVVAQFLDDGRGIQLTEEFAYVDPLGRRWVAAKDSKVDGASIPKVFWSVIGGPFEGAYRDASVLHDVACKLRKQKWEDVHRMFYNAMRCAGVDPTKAMIMYGAVYNFGPRWPDPTREVVGGLPPPPPPPPLAAPTDADVQKLTQFVQKQRPKTLEEIEAFSLR